MPPMPPPTGRRLVRATVVAFVLSPAVAPAADLGPDSRQATAGALLVQDAMRRGRDLLQHGRVKAAVDVLEEQLPRIDGNAAYLALLREAYATYVKELALANQDELGEVYRQRLKLIEQGQPRTPPPAAPRPPAPTAARGVSGDDEPVPQRPPRPAAPDAAGLSRAEQAFAAGHYREADELYAHAASGLTPLSGAQRSQWAYCKLYAVVDRLRQPGAPPADLEKDVTAALRLAEHDTGLTTFGRTVLDRLRQRPVGAASTVRHADRDANGWARAESANFRVFHARDRALAEQVARAAEAARARAFDKWAGPPPGDWAPACDVYLYPTGADYAKATRQDAAGPGHATYKAQGGAVTARRLDLRADAPDLLAAVVPHETTHLVLADLFAGAPLPRWADEGMAVLAEPRARRDRYARTLHTWRQRGQLVPIAQFVGRQDYPDRAAITAFYVQSASVVDYLVGLNGPRAFTQFLRDAQRGDLNAALKKHYNCRDVEELQDRWLRQTFPADARASSGR
jgi:hypothetical protein